MLLSMLINTLASCTNHSRSSAYSLSDTLPDGLPYRREPTVQISCPDKRPIHLQPLRLRLSQNLPKHTSGFRNTSNAQSFNEEKWPN